MSVDRLLQGARARYSAGECLRADPASEQYASARRWLACAREALRWSREVSGGREAMWLARACDALMRADEHRRWARRWRAASVPSPRWAAVPSQVPARALEDADRTETSSADHELEEAVRARSSIVAYYAAARQALALVRVYRSEAGTSGRREREVMREVARYRAAIRDQRAAWSAAVQLSRVGAAQVPGLSKTMPASVGRKSAAS